MKKDAKTSSLSLLSRLSMVETYAIHYAVLLFLLLLLIVYGFVALKIMSYSNIEPSQSQIASQLKTAAAPHVQPSVVQEMQSLQDHSVSVKALFDQARSNPFQE